MESKTNYCLLCDDWQPKEKVCTFDPCKGCVVKHCEGMCTLPECSEDGNPEEWNPDYRWDRTLDNPTEGNK